MHFHATEYRLVLDRCYDVAPKVLYTIWTDPSTRQGWYFGKDIELVDYSWDPVPAGRHMGHWRYPNGEEHRAEGSIVTMEPPRSLSFSWKWVKGGVPGPAMLVSLDFAPKGKGTRLTLTQEGLADDNAHERHAVGWSGVLENLEEYLRRRRAA